MSITVIKEDYLSYGQVRYFSSDRCFNDERLRKFNNHTIEAEELVTYDCGMMDLTEIDKAEVKSDKNKQVLGIIIRPEIEPDYNLGKENYFTFCGYDLVELPTSISAITNCGGDFDKAIEYKNLNEYGLISTYRDVVLTQIRLFEEYPEESHAYCEVVEMWRHING